MSAWQIPAGLELGGARLPLVDKARIYSCGITPYDVTHLGHAAAFVWVDVLSRVLHSMGIEPLLCRNITDVDDVLLAAAQRAGSHFDSFASVQQFRFEADMKALNVAAPQFAPRARRHIDQVIRLDTALLEAGAAYARDGSVYFRGAGTADRAGIGRDEAVALAAEYGDQPGDPAKEDALDPVIWRASAAADPGWSSPWGRGRPGWHAECAAMSLSVFGPAVDIHCGGADLRFPHHACQAAMTEAVTAVTPYARAHFPVGVVRVAGAKMAKSTGNLVLVCDVLRSHPAAALRLCLIDRPWAQSWDYTAAGLQAAADRLDRLYQAAGRRRGRQETAAGAITDFLRHNLDVPAALAVAEEAGGAAARSLIAVLGLSE